MRAVVQRVSEASVSVGGRITNAIGKGLLILLGIEHEDTQEDAEWLVKKIASLRIFNDTDGVMNLSLKDIDGQVLIVSQFTLHASTKKGNRPSYIRAAKPDTAIPLYNDFIRMMEKDLGKVAATGEFGAMMQVSLNNDGPVTIIIDSKKKE